MYKYVKSVMGDAIILATVDGVTEMTTMDEIDSIKDPIVGYNRLTKKIKVSTVEDVITQAQAREKLMGTEPTFFVQDKTKIGEYAEIKAVKTGRRETGEPEYDFIITARNSITTKCVLLTETLVDIASEISEQEEYRLIYCTLVYDLKDITYFNVYDNVNLDHWEGIELVGVRFINTDWSKVTRIGTLLHISKFDNLPDCPLTIDFSQLYLPNLREIESLLKANRMYVSDIKFPECPNLSADTMKSFKQFKFIETYRTDTGAIRNFIEFNDKLKNRLGFSRLQFKSGIPELDYTDYEKLRKQIESTGILIDMIDIYTIDKDFTEKGDPIKQVHKPTEKERASGMYTDLLSFLKLIEKSQYSYYYLNLYFTKDFDINISDDYLQIDVEELWNRVPQEDNTFTTVDVLVSLYDYLEEKNIDKTGYVEDFLKQLDYIKEGKVLVEMLAERSTKYPITLLYDEEMKEDKPKFKKFITFVFMLHLICGLNNGTTATKIECKQDDDYD